MRVKVLIIDVDGTLTDGSVYMGDNGEVMKRFNIKDGYAIHNILPEKGIIPVILTGRMSKIVENRCKELGINELYQGCDNKLQKLHEISQKMNIPLDKFGYIGDDLNDLECMKVVGYAACPKDAVEEVKRVCSYVANACGGCGAVREIIELL